MKIVIDIPDEIYKTKVGIADYFGGYSEKLDKIIFENGAPLPAKITINLAKSTINPEETELKLISALSAEEEIAQWIISGTKMYRYKECSKCKCMVSLGDMWKYCPMCGAKMKGDTE